MYRRSVLCLLLVCVMLLSASCVVAEATERERENYEETTVAETPLQEAETTTESLENSISEEKKALIASFKLFFASQEKETLSEDQLDALIPHHDMLKKISNMARTDCEKFMGTKVYLQTWVKVKENWRDNVNYVRSFGYHDE